MDTIMLLSLLVALVVGTYKLTLNIDYSKVSCMKYALNQNLDFMLEIRVVITIHIDQSSPKKCSENNLKKKKLKEKSKDLSMNLDLTFAVVCGKREVDWTHYYFEYCTISIQNIFYE